METEVKDVKSVGAKKAETEVVELVVKLEVKDEKVTLTKEVECKAMEYLLLTEAVNADVVTAKAL